METTSVHSKDEVVNSTQYTETHYSEKKETSILEEDVYQKGEEFHDEDSPIEEVRAVVPK
jgi:hypothetical protein